MKYFSINELTRSETARRLNIDNSPSETVVANLHRLVETVLDPAREALGKPINVSSGYRAPALNEAVGGARRSYHMQGRAADISTGTIGANRELLAIIRCLPHTELIWEQGGRWIHVAL